MFGFFGSPLPDPEPMQGANFDVYGNYIGDKVDPFSFGWDTDPYAGTSNPYQWYDLGYYGFQKGRAEMSTNAWNLYYNERNNYLEQQKWQAQNAWDLAMWNMNNEYNSPSQQMARLIAAGVNPVSASGVGNVPAQAVKGSSPNSTQPIAANSDDSRLAQEAMQFVSQNGLNATLGLGKLNIEQQKADIAAKVGDSEYRRNEKQANYLESVAEGQRLSNQWNLASFDVRLEEEKEKLSRLGAEILELKSKKDLNEEQINNLKSLEQKYNAERDLASERINEIRESIKQRNEQLRIDWYNARSNRINSSASASLAKTAEDRLAFDRVKLDAEVQKWNNEQLLQYMDKFGTDFQIKGKGRLGTKNNYVEGSGSYSGHSPNLDGFPLKAIVVCDEAVKRASEDPTPESLEMAIRADKLMKALSKTLSIPPVRKHYFTAIPDATSVKNPIFGLDTEY